MTPERHRRLMDLFDEVCDLGAGERAARLEALRAEDDALARELHAMLAADEGEDIIDQAAAVIATEFTLVQPGPPPRPSRQIAVPKTIGRYRVLRVLGEGGMGVVYEAEQDLPQRTVAVKVIRGQLATASLRKRFELETHILGRLNHPGICKIYEAATDAESCFFAMELVDGKPLTTHADAKELGSPARLALFARVCDAVHHAHLKGVIHLDLKPANILVGEDGQPKVLDFGIARFVDPDSALTGLTLTGQVLGTPAYMSPEQTALTPDALDARSDVYTLGAIGYELLTGRLPHDIKGKAVHEIIRIIREEDPRPISAAWPELRGDVETILGKALAREPEARYQSAAALADDVRRHLRNEPIEARAPTAAYQIKMFAKRNRGLVTALGALAAALLAGTIIASVLAARAERARAALAVRNDALTVLEARASLLEDPTRAAARLKTLSADGAWDDALAVAREAEALGAARHLLVGHESEVHGVAFAAGGAVVATASYDRTFRLWDLERGRARVWRLKDGLDVVVASGELLAVGGIEGELRLFDAGRGTSRALPGHGERITAAVWAADGSLLASGSFDGTLRLWRRDGGAAAVLAGHSVRVEAVTFSKDLGRVAAAAVDGSVRVWTTAGAPIATLRGHDDEAVGVAFIEGDRALVSAGRDGRVLRWTPEGGEPRTLAEDAGELKLLVAANDVLAWGGREGPVSVLVPGADLPRLVTRHESVVRALVFSPDGALLASGGDDRTVHVVDVASGDTSVLRGHDSAVRGLAFSHDGQKLASVADDGSGRVWRARRPMAEAARRVAVSSRGDLAVAGVDRAVRLALADGATHLLAGHTDEIYEMVFSPDARLLAAGSRDRTVRVWDRDGTPVAVLQAAGRASAVAFSASGRHLAAGIHTGAVKLWEVDGWRERPHEGHDARVNDVTFAGETLITAGDDRAVRAWDPAAGSGRALATLPDWVIVVAANGRGDVAAATTDGTVRIIAADGEVVELPGHRGEVVTLDWSPDGTTLASGGIDRTTRLWRDGASAAVLEGPAGGVVKVLFTADGAGVLAGAADGTLRVYPTTGARGRARLLTRGHGPVLDAALLPDGRAAVVNDEDGVRLVPVGTRARPGDVRELLSGMTATMVDDAGALGERWSFQLVEEDQPGADR